MLNIQEFQQFSKEQLDATTAAAVSVARAFQTIAAEATDYSKKSVENNSAYAESLLGAKSLEEAIRIQSGFAKSNYENFTTQVVKIGELYTKLAKEALKPMESTLAKVQAAAAPQQYAEA